MKCMICNEEIPYWLYSCAFCWLFDRFCVRCLHKHYHGHYSKKNIAINTNNNNGTKTKTDRKLSTININF